MRGGVVLDAGDLGRIEVGLKGRLRHMAEKPDAMNQLQCSNAPPELVP